MESTTGEVAVGVCDVVNVPIKGVDNPNTLEIVLDPLPLQKKVELKVLSKKPT